MPIRDKINKHVIEILRTLNNAGEEAYIVGGAVRDLLLDISPKDYDLATDAHPQRIKKIFGRKARIIGKRFKIVHLRYKGEIYEISTFRRKPTMEERKVRVSDSGLQIWKDNYYGNLEQDAYRRDFTVNALYYDPVNGKGLVDFVNGYKDLKEKKVRCIGDSTTRLLEDPVRILRALKLVGQYSFSLEEELADSIRKHKKAIHKASNARLQEEFFKIIKARYPESIFSAFHEYDFLQIFFPAYEKEWNTQESKDSRELLKKRYERMSTQRYSDSRVLGLGTIIFPFIRSHLRELSPSDTLFWEYFPEIKKECKKFIHHFFQPFDLPKFIKLRLAEMITIIPLFMQKEKRDRVMKSREYSYSRELLSLFLEFHKFDPEALSNWPLFSQQSHRRRKSTSKQHQSYHRRKGHNWRKN
ncbi:MAG: hypothetical protein U9O87_04550 [Verrucomicrobiota bacterium]|nr:hypothetical protein [Verrucomicrobiota bacterium]